MKNLLSENENITLSSKDLISLNSQIRSAQLSVKCFADEVFQKQYAMGRFNGIDFLQSNFKGYQIYMFYKKGND